MGLQDRDLEHMLGDEWTHKLPPICPNCGYNLTGSVSNRCPECGQVFLRKHLRQQASDLLFMIHQVEEANDLIRLGFFIALLGGGLLLLGMVLSSGGGFAGTLGRLAGFLCGLIAFFLGLALIRVARLPGWAVEQMKRPPDYGRAAITIALGLALMILSVFMP